MTRAAGLLVRLVLGGVFLYAGALKSYDPHMFANGIDQYDLLPRGGINTAAIILPWVEVVAGGLLVLGIWKRASALVLTGLTTGFFGAITSVLVRGLKIKCDCFGPVGTSFVTGWNLVLDGTLLALALWLVWYYRDEENKS